MVWKNQESRESFWLFDYLVLKNAGNFLNLFFLTTIMDLLVALKYCILIFLISIQKEFQPVKYRFFKNISQNLHYFQDVAFKCPKQFLYYIDFKCGMVCEKNFKCEFHVFGWFPSLQNLKVFWENLLFNKF